MKGFIIPLLLFFSITSVASATKNTPANLSELFTRLKEANSLQLKADKKREAKFVTELKNQVQKLNDLKIELEDAKKRSSLLRKSFDANETRQAELKKLLHDKSAGLGELFGVFSQSAGDMLATVRQSLVSAQIKGREIKLAKIVDSKKQPSTKDLENYWFFIMEEMCEMGKIAQFKAKVMDANGNESERQIKRFGVFTAISEGKFLTFIPETQTLYELARQPAMAYLHIARKFESTASITEVKPMVIDPSGGSLLSLLVQTPTLEERFHQGGLIGYVIAVLALIGVLVTVERLLRLFAIEFKVNRQLKVPDKPQTNNPLGRVLSIYDSNPKTNVEDLERKLDEAILKELPALEKGCSFLKLIYSIAPLLGLLGTVTGMIITFQAITLFGAGDPRLMAGGISQALVTTALGLIVAVPMVFCHSLVSSKAGRIIAILEQQSAGLLAQREENS